MQKIRPVEIKLQGQKIVLRSAEADQQLVDEIVELVASKLSDVEKRTIGKGVASHQIALLAMMELAGDYIRAKRNTIDFKKQVEERSARVLDLIDAEFKN
jgi:hypothetical protein